VSFVDFDFVHQQLHAADRSTVLSCSVRDNDTYLSAGQPPAAQNPGRPLNKPELHRRGDR